jgi:formylglycine-generating enzyme required for sulfatase activity
LPSELKWEFANRAGSAFNFHFGDGETELARYAWFRRNSGGRTHAVGQLLPNAYALYDTHGNVWEWISSEQRSYSVVRGGSWSNDARGLRSASRGHGPGARFGALGFRLERQISGSARSYCTFTLGEPEPEAKPGSDTSTSLSSFK